MCSAAAAAEEAKVALSEKQLALVPLKGLHISNDRMWLTFFVQIKSKHADHRLAPRLPRQASCGIRAQMKYLESRAAHAAMRNKHDNPAWHQGRTPGTSALRRKRLQCCHELADRRQRLLR